MKIKSKKICRSAAVVLLSVILLCAAVGCSTPKGGEEQGSLQLTYREETIRVGAEIEALLPLLGEDYTVVEAASCAGIGKDYVYTYPSLRIYVFAPENGVATVTSACYTDDGASHKGVTIGSSASDVVASLGKADEQSDSRITYRDGDVSLTFTLRDGVASAVVLAEE